MNYNQNEHLTEEQLMEYMTGSNNPTLQEHINNCQECALEIQELRKVSLTLKNIDDEEVPSILQRRIFHSMQTGRSGISKLLGSPFLSTIIALMVIMLLYFLIGALITEQ